MIPGEKLTNVAAGAAALTPWWLPALHDVSQVAALLLPVAGVIWFAVQIGVKLHTTYWKKK